MVAVEVMVFASDASGKSASRGNAGASGSGPSFPNASCKATTPWRATSTTTAGWSPCSTNEAASSDRVRGVTRRSLPLPGSRRGVLSCSALLLGGSLQPACGERLAVEPGLQLGVGDPTGECTEARCWRGLGRRPPRRSARADRARGPCSRAVATPSAPPRCPRRGRGRGRIRPARRPTGRGRSAHARAIPTRA